MRYCEGRQAEVASFGRCVRLQRVPVQKVQERQMLRKEMCFVMAGAGVEFF